MPREHKDCLHSSKWGGRPSWLVVVLLVTGFLLLASPVAAQDTPGWDQVGADIDSEGSNDWSGSAVASSADGTRIAVGAPGNDANGLQTGHVRVYQYDSNSALWLPLGDDIDGEYTNDPPGGSSGHSVAMNADGTRIAIGAPNNDGNGPNSGHVRVYQYTVNPENGRGAWVQLGTDIDGENADDQSGYSVAMNADGTRITIGAYLNDGNGDRSGHVRVYDYDAAGGASSWVQLGTDIDGENADDRSGWSVAMNADGTRITIGAPNNDGNGPNSGHVRVYEYGPGGWLQVGTDIDGETAGDRSGRAVAMNAGGTRVTIGSALNGGSGHVRVYEYAAGAWVQLGTDINGESAGDRSGGSVAVNAAGSQITIGAALNDGNGGDSGHVRVYEFDTGAARWVQVGADIDGENPGDSSGQSVAINADGTRIAIGATRNDGNGPLSGHVRVYDYKTNAAGGDGKWVQLGGDIDGEGPGDASGRSVVMNADGTRIAISNRGSFPNGPGAGSVRVFEYDTNAAGGAGDWVQIGADIDGETREDNAGFSLAMDAGGTRIAIGAYLNDGNGDRSGHVRVYQYDANAAGAGGGWVQLGADIDGESARDFSGRSVAMNAQGTRIAIGADGNDGNGESSGSARVFEYDLDVAGWVQVGNGIDGEKANDQSGSPLAMNADGTRIMIGAPRNDGNGPNSGHVRVYEYAAGGWQQLGADIDGERLTDESGSSVAMNADGTRIAIGAPNNDGNGSDSGHVRVYEFELPSCQPGENSVGGVQLCSNASGPEVAHTGTCLGGNGRVDTMVVNTTTATATYRIEFPGLSARQLVVEPGDWWRVPITGRSDDTYLINVLRDGTTISQQQVAIACDTAPPQISAPEIQITNACRAGSGYVLFQIANSTDRAVVYIVKFDGVRNRSATVAAHGQTLRAITGRPNGTYTATVDHNGHTTTAEITIDC